MCGIAFIVNYDPKKDIPLDTIKELFENLKSRGRDASGYYFERMDGNERITRLIKSPVPSNELFETIHTKYENKEKEKFYERFRLTGKEKLILFHCRARTKGSEYNNRNNMPIESEEYVLIHNGIISNSKIDAYKYKAEVDSEEILANIQTHGLEEGLLKVSGSMAIVLKPIMKPVMYLYRNNNPLDVMYFMKEKLLIGSSASEYIPISEAQCAFSQTVFSPLVTITSPVPHYLYEIDLEKPRVTMVHKIEDKENKGRNVTN